ncbi:MAG: hypothetical protein COB54_06500 [Alphaproteobacteria bacterium]|nr:MAG: hypothetical protein COB54_06500 [Alphaproteobacteria bacterium]
MKTAATIVFNMFRLSVAAVLFSAGFSTLSYAQEPLQNTPHGKPMAVSLDYCADQFILSLADRDQIMALTTEAIESHSFYQKQARGLPLYRATAEEVLQMAPDVVIRNWGGTKMLPLLARANIPVASSTYGIGPQVLYQNMRVIGAALDQGERAEKLIRDHQVRWAALEKKVAQENKMTLAKGRKLHAAYIAPGGITAGKNTFVNDIIKLAGLASLSEEFGLVGWQPLPLEALVQNPPDIIIGSFFNQKNIHVSQWSLARHGKIREMLNTIPTIIVPGRYLSCNGIFSVDAAEFIQSKLETLIK